MPYTTFDNNSPNHLQLHLELENIVYFHYAKHKVLNMPFQQVSIRTDIFHVLLV